MKITRRYLTCLELRRILLKIPRIPSETLRVVSIEKVDLLKAPRHTHMMSQHPMKPGRPGAGRADTDKIGKPKSGMIVHFLQENDI